MGAVLGLDIGGANLKAAHTVQVALTRPFPLWKHPDELANELREIRQQMPPHERLAVTMTGELCDCFASRAEGVCAIVRSVEVAADGAPVQVWTSNAAWATPDEVRADPLAAAAANWLALAHWAAERTDGDPALLIDVGSTTTDLTYLNHGRPEPRGRTDRQRLASGELVYTGVGRTPVCAVLGMGVAAELFATMLDAYLVLGLLSENPADSSTADGRPATRPYAHARLARLLCADAAEVSDAEVESLARRAIDTQVRHVRSAVDTVLGGRPAPQRIIVAGSGAVLARQVLMAHPILGNRQAIILAERLGPTLSEAACAYAVASLATHAQAR